MGKTIHENASYACNQCEYKATWKTALKRHIAPVHINYYCDRCGYKATRIGDIKMHMKTVHESVTYKCEYGCGYKTSSKKELEIHNEEIHWTDHFFSHQTELHNVQLK